MNVCIYLYRDRLIHWSPQTLFSKPISLAKVRWYTTNVAPPVPLDQMVQAENYSYDLKKGYYTLNEPLPVDWSDRANLVKQIQILGSFNTMVNTHKSRYTDNSIGQGLTDILLYDEIREFRTTGNLENCTIFASLLETEQPPMTPDALATKLWLRYESYRTIIAYLNRLEFRLRQFMEDNKFNEATTLLSNEFEKMKV